jgi:hypothetical protein
MITEERPYAKNPMCLGPSLGLKFVVLIYCGLLLQAVFIRGYLKTRVK